MIVANTDFLCEKRLKGLDLNLHLLYKNSIFAIDRLLTNYKAVFPFFTNHTFEHSEQVINYCNIIAGSENIEKLNADEIYILLMGASLHDVGMGISESDIYELKYNIKGFAEYEHNHPYTTLSELARKFHQEFGAEFVKKYRDVFEIPTDEHLYCICQVIRGHRKMDFLDKKEFSPRYMLQNGNAVRLPYIASLVKLADEIDVTSDRNLFFDYSVTDSRWSKKQTMCYKCHKAIKKLCIKDSVLTLCFDTQDNDVYTEIMNMQNKVHKTFKEFADVVKSQNDFTLMQNSVCFLRQF
ncbi:MAG: HD domain-containing protein [Clostridia bacterium]|nr:HD domain-containing protein [Clostridia bacterium]